MTHAVCPWTMDYSILYHTPIQNPVCHTIMVSENVRALKYGIALFQFKIVLSGIIDGLLNVPSGYKENILTYQDTIMDLGRLCHLVI